MNWIRINGYVIRAYNGTFLSAGPRTLAVRRPTYTRALQHARFYPTRELAADEHRKIDPGRHAQVITAQSVLDGRA
jgi:hypothetical protein